MDKKNDVCRIYYSFVSSRANTKDFGKFLKENYFVKGKLNCMNNKKKMSKNNEIIG